MKDINTRDRSHLWLTERTHDLEKKFLTGRRSRTEDLENAVRIFLEFLRGFKSLDIEEPAVTVFGSARFKEIHPFYQLAPLGRSGCFDESQCLLLTRHRPESTG